MIMTQEKRILKAKKQFEQLCESIRLASGQQQRIDEVEENVFGELLAIGHSLLESFIAAAGDGDRGKQVARDGENLRRSEKKHGRRYVSVFGEHQLRRFVYARREKQKIEWMPLDEELGLPSSEYSYLLHNWAQRMCLKESFDESRQSLADLLGINIPVRTLEAMNHQAAKFVGGFRQQLQAPHDDEELLVYSNDCKGIPMRRRREDSGQRRKRRRKGEKVHQKQMACVGAAYSIARYVRRADEVLDEWRREASSSKRPRPKNKRVWAEMTRALKDGETSNGKTLVFVQQAIDLYERDPQQRKTALCIMDGERALWNQQNEWLSRCIGILDIYHVMERLWDCAHCFHAEGTLEAEQFVERRLRLLLEGKVGYVIGGLKRLKSQRSLSASKRRTLNATIQYYENNRWHMKYDEYLAAGYPIGSGVAEGACRHVVKDRMEQTGMRWTVKGAQSMLNLRSTYINGDWEDFNEYRIRTEQDRLYGKKAA
jgi:hypothetical protein